jgi:DNA repair protein RecN (Recombination protein N)
MIEAARLERQDLEYNLRELRSARISKGEEEKIIRELDIGHMSANLRQDALVALDTLYSGSPCLMDLAGQVRRLFTGMANIDPDIKDDISSINSIIAQIEELNYSLKDRIKGYEFAPERIQELESRLQTIGELKRKYNTDEVGLLGILEKVEARLSMIEDEEYLIEDARNAFQSALGLYIKGVRSFLVKRKSFGKRLCTSINHDLAKLGMAGTKFSIHQSDESAFDNSGIDCDIGNISPNKTLRGEFVISTNVGQDMLPLARVASGGELSRIMLVLKCHQRKSQDTTIVFDEIDSGISGEAAIMMANRLKEISGGAQTIVVTHLHSLASLANTHLLISKDIADNATTSHVKMVTGRERVMELARMMGGINPSDTVVAHAKELADRAQYEG